MKPAAALVAAGRWRLRARWRLAFTLLAVPGFLPPSNASAAAWRFEAGLATNAWVVKVGSQTVLAYAFDPRRPKPYVREFAPLGGPNILRDAPPDHLHHHGLMYAIKVNGLNFWEETPGNGVQRVIATQTSATRKAAVLRQVIHWVAPQDAFVADTTPHALLVERRTLTLRADEAARELALEWRADFEVGGKTNEIQLGGNSYHGLGMRFAQELDPLAIHSYAGRPPDLSHNRQEVSSTPWAAVSFARPESPATIALVPHPANEHGDGRMFAMLTPFAYLSATQGLDKEPIPHRQGDQFTVRYLVLLYPEIKTTAALDARARQWRGSPP
jgi:hypothetical protein